MKKQLRTLLWASCIVPCISNAAESPTQKNVAAPPTSETIWTGFNAGLNAGGVWSNSPTVNVNNWPFGSGSPSGSQWSIFHALATGSVNTGNQPGFIGGGQIGYDWQTKVGEFNIISGVEADIQGNTGFGGRGYGINNYAPNTRFISEGGVTLTVNTATNVTASQQLNYLGTFRSRIGYLLSPNVLVYGTGGLAYGAANTNVTSIQNSHASVAFNGVPLPQSSLPVAAYGNGSNSAAVVGWTAGAGLEWMFLKNWSVKTEYLYYDLGRVSGNFMNYYHLQNAYLNRSGIDSLNQYSTRIGGNIIRAGINYHFSWDTIPAVVK